MTPIDGERIADAIAKAERGTTGIIAVRLFSGGSRDALKDARKHFILAQLHRHEHRNAVVFFVAPGARRFAVFGDRAIHERAGEPFWRDLVEAMQPYFAQDRMTEGLEYGIARVGEKLREQFPAEVPV